MSHPLLRLRGVTIFEYHELIRDQSYILYLNHILEAIIRPSLHIVLVSIMQRVNQTEIETISIILSSGNQITYIITLLDQKNVASYDILKFKKLTARQRLYDP